MRCLYCDEPIDDDAAERIACLDEHGYSMRGVHAECAVRAVVGGINHQMGLCVCCGGTEPPDPPGMTRREAALAAVAYYRRVD